MTHSPKSLISRPLDLVYFVYFATHIPITFLIDFQVFYPAWIVPEVLRNVLRDYVAVFKDPFMGSKTPVYWFLSFIVCEALFQTVFFFFACYGLKKDSLNIRLPLAVYGAHVATTVLPTLAEVLLNPELLLTLSERLTLCCFYMPYFVLPLVMLFDSYRRVSSALSSSQMHTKTD